MDQARLRELYETYGHHVFARCRYLLRDEDEAWDALQEVFLKVEQGLVRFEGRSGMLRWIDRIALNHCLNLLRARKVRRGQGLVEVESLEQGAGMGQPGTMIPGQDWVGERAHLVRSLLESFEPQLQAIAILSLVNELSQEEVAQQVGLSVPTVRKRLRQFLERARRIVEKEGGPVAVLPRLRL